MGSIWLDMGSYLVRMKRTGSRKLSKCLPDLWDTIKIQKVLKNQENPGKFGNPYIPYIPFKGLWVCCPIFSALGGGMSLGYPFLSKAWRLGMQRGSDQAENILSPS